MEECNGEIANEKVKTLLKMYAEKVNDGQKSFAIGVRYVVDKIGIVDYEEIKKALDDKLEKKKREGTNEIENLEVKKEEIVNKYVENLKINRKETAFGIRFALLYLGIVTDEDIHFALTGETVKKKRKSKKRK